MARRYDLQDPYDLKVLEANYSDITREEWEACIDYANRHPGAVSKGDIQLLYKFEKKAANTYGLSALQLQNAIRIFDNIAAMKQHQQEADDLRTAVRKGGFVQAAKHVTFRVAWHDNKWNGHVCNDPSANRYCSGFHTLLSDRLRTRKEAGMDKEIAYRGKAVSEEYLPPCFWGINIFGSSPVPAAHDNPAEPRLTPIKDELPARSLYSWPFSISFNKHSKLNKADGDYPKNLESVRIPLFQGKIQERTSIGFIYTKFSNPLTEEELQYLVVGCGLIVGKGPAQYFKPAKILEEKRASKPAYRNFPAMNWALSYSFEEGTLVRMPYHEYLDYTAQPGTTEEARQAYLDKIKVAVSEPELEHCFKYVAMDIDDDEAIYILTKMRQKLIDCRSDGIVPPDEMDQRIAAVDSLLGQCWQQRSYFPGFVPVSRQLLGLEHTAPFLLDDLIPTLQQREGSDYGVKFIELLAEPASDSSYKKYLPLLRRLKSVYEENYELSDDMFLQLCLLNLNRFQFERVLQGKLVHSGAWNKTIDDERASHSIKQICDNPYLLFEEYKSYEGLKDENTGEEKDSPIELFKIDIAYFPDSRFDIDRLDIQYTMKNNDKRRLRALLIRYLHTLEDTGHCFADAATAGDAIKAYPLFYHAGKEYRLAEGFFDRLSNDYINHFEAQDKLKVVQANDTAYFYLSDVYEAEMEVAGHIEQLLQEPSLQDSFPGLDAYLDKSCAILEGLLKGHFDRAYFKDERTRLYTSLFTSRLFVLAGSPGSGKSHELLNVITELQRMGQPCLVLAPTGKAVLRLKSDPGFPGIEAYTLDRFLADITAGKMNALALQGYKNLVIDEMSMVDLLKLRQILHQFRHVFKIPSFKRLILVGDPNQLPAIGYGKVFKDILYYLKTHPACSANYIELETNCRHQLADSLILDFSQAYTTDGEPDKSITDRIVSGNPQISPGFRVRFWQDSQELNGLIGEEFDRLPGGADKERSAKLNSLLKIGRNGKVTSSGDMDLEGFQILSPYRADFFGTESINEHIQATYKADQPYELADDYFKHADKIIRTKNYYEADRLVLSNGSMGLIVREGGTSLYFPELPERKPLSGDNGIRKAEQEYFELAYAITVHKAQGTGFDHVFVVLPKKLSLLSKELLYTALTRSRVSVTLFVQGTAGEPFHKTVLEKARIRSYTESRRTSLMLDKPFRYYALEADGYFLESRVELLIYQALKMAQQRVGVDSLAFVYEVPPVIDGAELPMKTDFTISTAHGTWYWEHLGRLGNRRYESTWQELKKPSYIRHGAYERLLTTHERSGLNPDKISAIIELLLAGDVSTEDTTNRYSLHHYSLR